MSEQKRYFVWDKKEDAPICSFADLDGCYRLIENNHELYEARLVYDNTMTVYDKDKNEIRKYKI